MKKVRKLMKNKWFACSLSGFMFFISCEKQAIVTETINTTENAETRAAFADADADGMTGEQMFREILFLEGDDVAGKIPQYAEYTDLIASLPDDVREERTTYTDLIVDEIGAIDPDYFTHFKSVIDSKDPYAITNELRSASDVVLSVSESIPEYGMYAEDVQTISDGLVDAYDLTTPDGVEAYKTAVLDELAAMHPEFEGAGADAELAVCVAVVVVVVLAAAVAAAAVAIVFVFWGAVANPDVAEVSLRNEEIVNSIIENY